jgi:superfamily I DNA/RNA helicase
MRIVEEELKQKEGGIQENILKIMNEKNIEKDLSEVLSRVGYFEKEENPIQSFLSYLKELKNQEYFDPNVDVVTLLTMHAAKGLEFNDVFVIGKRKERVGKVTSEKEEEKRLVYVALTRAKKNLFVIHTKKRFGKKLNESEIDKILIDKAGKEVDMRMQKIEEKRKKIKLKKAQQSLF